MAAYTIVVSFGDGASVNLAFTSGSLTLFASHNYSSTNTYTISALLSGASASSTPATQTIEVSSKLKPIFIILQNFNTHIGL